MLSRLTSPFLLLISYKVGTLFIIKNIKNDYKNLIDNAPKIGYVLIISTAITSALKGLLVYFITKYGIDRRRRLRFDNLNNKIFL